MDTLNEIKMLTLRQKQSLFTKLAAELILEAYRQGFEVTFGEAYRSPEEALRLSKTGKGISKSLHTMRLAIDLQLFKDSKYLTQTEQYASLGKWWKAQNPDCRWGGDFKSRPDGNHFSVAHDGIS